MSLTATLNYFSKLIPYHSIYMHMCKICIGLCCAFVLLFATKVRIKHMNWKYTEEGVSNYMCPSLNYTEALTSTDLVSLNEHHRNLCNALFNDIVNGKSHRLHSLLPPLHKATRYT